MIKRIQLRGISHIPSDRMTKMGGCSESINVALENEEIVPASAPVNITAEFGGETFTNVPIYVHELRDIKNLILVGSEDSNSTIYFTNVDTEETEVGSFPEDQITGVTSFGNLICIYTETKAYYARWNADDSNYDWLGELFQEPEVDEKYYLSAEQVGKILEHCERKQLEGCGFSTAFRNKDEIATSITTQYGGRETDTYIVEEVCGLSRSRDKSGKVVKRNLNPYVNCLHTGIGGHCRENMEVFVTEVVAGALRGRGSTGQYVQKLELNEEGVTNTLTSVEKDNLIVEYGGRLVRIRRLTPREAFRLMDMDECNIDKIMSAGISNTQMYKMAGNSIVVEPMFRIFRNLLTPEESDIVKDTLF